MNAAEKLHPEYQIGAPLEGGYFAGVIGINGEPYAVIVSPVSEGSTDGKWGEYGTEIDARSLSDGLANTTAMADAGSPIAQWARNLNIGGHTDWYIPARDELELLYRYLKPTTSKNICSFRDGENPSALPPTGLYEKDSPAQTMATDFQKDGEQALAATWHWSSTQYSAHDAFIQVFSDGYQGDSHKDDTLRVRAVRRFKLAH